MECLLCTVVRYSLVFLSVVFLALYLYVKYRHGYWKRKGVEYIQPSFPFGNIGSLFDNKTHVSTIFKRMYKQTKGPFAGFYRLAEPCLLIKDPQLIKQILVKDFNNFADRGVHTDPEDPLSGHLFRLTGTKWKNLRIKLRPTFTSGKLKMMFPLLIQQGHHLQDHLKQCAKKGGTVNAKDACLKFTLDVIDSVVFGIETNSFENPNNEMMHFISTVFGRLESMYFSRIMQKMAFVMPSVIKFFRYKMFDNRITEFLYSILRRIINYREEKKETRNDFLQLMIQLRNKGETSKEDDASDKSIYEGNKVEGISFPEIAAQSFVFLFAGFDTSAATMSFALYELARNPDIQKKVQKEIKDVLERYDDKFSYGSVYEMEYLGMIVSETLRMYPILSFLQRVTQNSYEIPDSGVIIEKGTQLFIPLTGLHKDPNLFPEPEIFKPERFSKENRDNIVPYSYMPFGDGPRNCIGMQMGKMQSRVGLAMILNKYTVSTCPETPKEIRLAHGRVLLTTEKPIILSVTENSE